MIPDAERSMSRRLSCASSFFMEREIWLGSLARRRRSLVWIAPRELKKELEIGYGQAVGDTQLRHLVSSVA